MLTTRAVTAKRLARSFATVVDSKASGIKVAAVDNGQPTTAVTFLVKAGSRYEPTAGAAHALKNFAFKSTATRSTLGTVRESELYGGVLSATLSREYLALTTEFLRGDEPFFTSLLASVFNTSKFLPHEYSEYVLPVVRDESISASRVSGTVALEAAHALAFRTGLGASLLASPHGTVSLESVKSYAASAFTSGNLAVVGTGIDSARLAGLVDQAFAATPLPSGTSLLPSPASKYFGGSTRIASHTGGQTLFIGFGSTTPSAALSVLTAHLAPTPALKWPSIPSSSTTLTPVYLPYSDAALFGVVIHAPHTGDVRVAAKTVIEKLKKPLGAEELKAAVAHAKFSAAAALESRNGVAAALGKNIFKGTEASVESVLTTFDKVDIAAISKTVSEVTKATPTLVAVGDISTLPYADELGL